MSNSMVLNVQLPCQLTVLCTWGKQAVKIFTALAILKATATISTKVRCASVSGPVIVPVTKEAMTPLQAGIQCPGSLFKKYLSLRLKSWDKTFIPAETLKMERWLLFWCFLLLFPVFQLKIKCWNDEKEMAAYLLLLLIFVVFRDSLPDCRSFSDCWVCSLMVSFFLI